MTLITVPPKAPVHDLESPVIDVAVPVFDEEEVLEQSITRLHGYLSREFPFSWRITIIDNASTDATPRIAAALAGRLPGVRWIRLAEKGRGRALRTTWSDSDATVVAYTDVDLSTDLGALLPLVAPLVSGHSDIAIGCRLAPSSSVARGPKREIVSRGYNLLVRALTATRVRDLQCGFKAVRADVARHLVPAVRDDAWFFDTELLLLAERNGLRIHEVPVDWIDDSDSRVAIADTAWRDLCGTVRMVRTFATGHGVVELGRDARRPLDDDFGRRGVRFAAVGILSTAVSLAVFLVLRRPLGAVAANVVAVTATFVGNTWAHARLTMGSNRPRWRGAVAVWLASLALTSAALTVVIGLGGGLVAELATIAVTWGAATAGRSVLLARRTGRGRR